VVKCIRYETAFNQDTAAYNNKHLCTWQGQTHCFINSYAYGKKSHMLYHYLFVNNLMTQVHIT